MKTKQDKINTPYKIKSNLATYKEIDESKRIVQLIANTYNFYDFDGDVLRMGCSLKSIKDRGAKSNAYDKILHAKDHNLQDLPGKSILEVETVLEGNPVLYCETKLSESTDGEDLLTKYIEGIYNQHSIGFQYKVVEYVEKETEAWDEFLKDLINPEDAIAEGWGWDVKEIKLFEFSTVALGANKLTPYLGVKSTNKNVYLANIYTKMDALFKKQISGNIKNQHNFDLQHLQLKQLIKEMFSNFSGQDTSSKEAILKEKLKQQESQRRKEEEIFLNNLI